MNEYGIKLFLERVSVGDELTVNFTERGERCLYWGIVEKVDGESVSIKGTAELDFFEALSYPAMQILALGRIWGYSVKKADGTEYYC